NGRHQLHPVVGGLLLPTEQFLLVLSVAQPHPPPSRARVTATGPIGVDDHLRGLGIALVPIVHAGQSTATPHQEKTTGHPSWAPTPQNHTKNRATPSKWTPTNPSNRAPQPHQRHPQTQRWAPANDRSPHTKYTLRRTTPAPAPPPAAPSEPPPRRSSHPPVSSHAGAHACPTDPPTPRPRCHRSGTALTGPSTANPTPRPGNQMRPHAATWGASLSTGPP